MQVPGAAHAFLDWKPDARTKDTFNRFGVPWMPAYIAAAVPALVLIFSHDLESLAALYAIGVIGAVAGSTVRDVIRWMRVRRHR